MKFKSILGLINAKKTSVWMKLRSLSAYLKLTVSNRTYHLPISFYGSSDWASRFTVEIRSRSSSLRSSRERQRVNWKLSLDACWQRRVMQMRGLCDNSYQTWWASERTSSNAVKEPISERLSSRLHDQTSFCLLVFQVQEVCHSTAFICDWKRF